MDHDNSHSTAAYGANVPSQPFLQHRPAALQVHYLSSCIWVQVQCPKTTLSVHYSSVFLEVDAAGGRKAAGLHPGRAAVKVPAGYTRFSLREKACLQSVIQSVSHSVSQSISRYWLDASSVSSTEDPVSRKSFTRLPEALVQRLGEVTRCLCVSMAPAYPTCLSPQASLIPGPGLACVLSGSQL